MRAKPIIIKVLKFLGKALLGLLLLLFVTILLIHVPAVQKQVTRKVESYLSERTKSNVTIDRIRFSLLGTLVIEGAKLQDGAKKEIISIGRMEAKSNILELLKGQYNIKQISISDVQAYLIEDDKGLNIQLILDAFQSKEKKDTTSREVNIHFNSVELKNISFTYASTISHLTIDAKLGEFLSDNIIYSTSPLRLKADKVSLTQTSVDILTAQETDVVQMTDTTISRTQLNPDFGLGMGLEIAVLDVTDTDFSFHHDTVWTTTKFDGNHVDMQDINVSGTEILMREDTLAVASLDLSMKMPGFDIDEAKTSIQMNQHGFALSGFKLASNQNTLQADFRGWYLPDAPSTLDQLNVEINSRGHILPVDLAYFFPESMMMHVRHWDTTNIVLDATYVKGVGVIREMDMHTENSRLEASGSVNDILDSEKLQWNDLILEGEIGPDLKRTIKPFLDGINIPPNMDFQLTSSGDLKDILVDGKLNSTWGNVKLKGHVMPKGNNLGLDMDLTGERIMPDAFMDLPWLGRIDLTATAKGTVGSRQNAVINGFISSITVLDQPIRSITFESKITNDSLYADVTIKDPAYKSHIIADVGLAEPMNIQSTMELADFNAGNFLKLDSTFLLTGNFNTDVSLGASTIEGFVLGDSVRLNFGSVEYELDSMNLVGLLSPAESRINYRADDAIIDIESNFDLLASQEMLQTWAKSVLSSPDSLLHSSGTRALSIDLKLTSPGIFHVLGMDVTNFDTIFVNGAIDEQKQTADLIASTGHFTGFGISLDSFYTQATAIGSKVTASMDADNVFYAKTDIGSIGLDMHTNRDTVAANLILSRDTSAYLDFHTRLLPINDGVQIYPDALEVYGMNYLFAWNEPVYVSDTSVVFDQLRITHEKMQLGLDGDLNAFDIEFINVDLTKLNEFYFHDSTVINAGYLNGMISYVRNQQLDLQANVDSLSLYQSAPIAITLTAVKEGNEVPFNFALTNTSNRVNAEGKYFMDQKSIDGSILVDVNDLELFSFLVADVLDEMHGSIKADAKIKGPIAKPDVKGQVRFVDAGFTTAGPSLNFNIKDDVIYLDTSGLSFKNFTVYDEHGHPLRISGNLDIADFPEYAYDLKIKTEEYTLINTPESSNEQLKGLLDVGADITLKGNTKDTYVNAKIDITDMTRLIYVVADDDISMLNTDGIIEFVEPGQLLDTTHLEKSASYYDSLVAALPDFSLTSEINIQRGATIKIITNEQSGDYLEAAGVAKLDLVYDRSGALKLNGEYTIERGLYRVSFYDLVKKNFVLTPGSSIIWRGNPENGDLNITAENKVASNSIGLIANEVAENELTIYKHSLDYIVGIRINGTIEKPIVSFSLDLSKEDRASYPVLASKLDRMKQPDFQTELNKQVFGLLVLGGFLPETSGADVDQGLIATTAISNSVNSLLAGQLNRFAGQYIKGVNIDVGLQSYSDYSAPGGKTKTTLDFKVSKSILNERLSFEIGGDFDINSDQSGGNTGDNYRGDVAIIYDLTGNGDKVLKLFNNETYDIVYQEIRNTGISLIFIREFNKGEKRKRKEK